MDYEDEGLGRIKPFYETYVKISLVIYRAVSLATFAVTAAGLPFDNIKVKMMKMTTDESGQMLYKGVGDCVMKVNRKNNVQTFRREGIFGPWIGFWTFWIFAAPHTSITFLTMDYLHKWFGKQSK